MIDYSVLTPSVNKITTTYYQKINLLGKPTENAIVVLS